MSNPVWDNFRYFMCALKTLGVSTSLTLEGGSFCVSTGTYSENMVCCERNVKPETVREVLDFFSEREEAFMWPVLDDNSRRVLEQCGVPYAGDLAAMTLKVSELAQSVRVREGVTFERVGRENVNDWARTNWLGFGGGDDVPGNYYAFSEALSECEEVSLYLAKSEGECACTFAVADDGVNVGVYYLATVPEFRRKGIASSMMKKVCELSGGKDIVLQSTPSGVEFYRACGFSEDYRMPVYSTEEDIF